jgi:hypothetical protein
MPDTEIPEKVSGCLGMRREETANLAVTSPPMPRIFGVASEPTPGHALP